uniref:YceD family protein n=1 Tax=Alistipes sp. TaxID=1872444 RepID=UPI004056C8F4
MEQIALYTIAYKGLKSGSYEYDFQVDDSLFEAYDRVEIKGGRCDAHVTLKRSETMLELNVTINGEVICECDRCLEDCPIAVDYEGDLVVKFSDEIDDYDGEVMWISPSEDFLDLTQYIYESIVLTLPYRRVHEEGGCNPEMLASFSVATEEEIERMEAEAEESDVCGLDDYNKELLEALKHKMEGKE